ncbi:MAG: 16S rRNA (cytosine(1402)-N(4))-methyltransferase RsmH [Desulfobacterales bacterium]|nr:16S rRNA (cytosine(1402)-N(4))-methyltransferase RsmH [Desulfobacterales bacterium]
MSYRHTPAMLSETIHYLGCSSGKTYVDCTLGGAGHAQAICRAMLPDGSLIGIDQDRDAIENARRVLAVYESRVTLVHDNFASLPRILSDLKVSGADGILADLGISWHHLQASGRGFSFQKEEPLDMRMDVRAEIRAADIVNGAQESELIRIFRDYGEERRARRIARRIVDVRKRKPILTSAQLAGIVLDCVPQKMAVRQKIHPATRVFMALRIAVNHELERLETFMDHVLDCLNSKGRLCVLSFHSLEDRIVKHRIKAMAAGCICHRSLPQCVCGNTPKVRSLTPKAVRPSAEEIAANPMARSTRLRAMEKL